MEKRESAHVLTLGGFVELKRLGSIKRSDVGDCEGVVCKLERKLATGIQGDDKRNSGLFLDVLDEAVLSARVLVIFNIGGFAVALEG